MGRKPKRETRSLEDPKVPISDAGVLRIFGLDGLAAATDVPVTVRSALRVPAVWAAVNFISGTLASLPLHLYRRVPEGRERVTGPLALVLADAVNDETSSFRWRKSLFDAVFTHGRGFSFIERAATGRVLNLWNLDPTKMSVARQDGRTLYRYSDGGRPVTYAAAEIIDLPFMLAPDGLHSLSPVHDHADTIGLAIAATQWGGRFFQNGGVPPFAITGPFQSAGSLQRAADDMDASVRKAAKDRRLALTLPRGLEIKSIGSDPEKTQLVELKRFLIEEVARIYSLPPVFLQDLTHGTFSNTEQQDLHFVKHTLRRWAEQFEQELNLKLFGRTSNRQYAELEMDGVLRGDFATRMNGYAQAVQNAILRPNEVRALENRPDDPAGGLLMIQSGTAPVRTLAATPDPPDPPDRPDPPEPPAATDAKGADDDSAG